MNIGIAGAGRMGTAIARRLLDLGHRVQIWNRTVDNAQEARTAGAAALLAHRLLARARPDAWAFGHATA